jgi:hypothetical protein
MNTSVTPKLAPPGCEKRRGSKPRQTTGATLRLQARRAMSYPQTTRRFKSRRSVANIVRIMTLSTPPACRIDLQAVGMKISLDIRRAICQE